MLFCQLAGDFVSLWCIYIQGVEYGVQLTAIFEQKAAQDTVAGVHNVREVLSFSFDERICNCIISERAPAHHT